MYFKNKGVTVPDKIRPHLKKAHRISNKMIVVIDEILVEQFSIDDENTWFEQIQTEDGILLKIQRKSGYGSDKQQGYAIGSSFKESF